MLEGELFTVISRYYCFSTGFPVSGFERRISVVSLLCGDERHTRIHALGGENASDLVPKGY